jgi:hypothetical protein
VVVKVGDVVLMFDGTVRPPKHKRLLCVCASEGIFLRINSRPNFPPHMPFPLADNPNCLDHDSYIELRGVLEIDLDYLYDCIAEGDAVVLGVIGVRTAIALREEVTKAVTLNPREKYLITGNLSGLI